MNRNPQVGSAEPLGRTQSDTGQAGTDQLDQGAASFDTAHIHAHLAPVFRAEAAREADHVYQFEIAGRDAFHLEVRFGTLRVGAGTHPEPSVRFLFEDLTTAIDVVSGRRDPITAFMAGQVRTDGNLILALQLGLLFRP